jgi:chromosome segregation ATPase
LRGLLEKQYEAREDLQDELKEMTQMFLNMR